MPIEGAIHIDLAVADGLYSRVEIRNQRLLSATVPLVGRSVSGVPALVARLFSICRMAQGIASAEAIEQALNQVPAQGHWAARRFLIAGETVLEHASRACLDWPQWLGEPPMLAQLKSLRGTLAELHLLVYPGGDWMCPGGGALHVDGALLKEKLAVIKTGLDQAVFGAQGGLDAETWAAWLESGETVAARLAARLHADGLTDFGAMSLPALPEFDRQWLESRLDADQDGDFIGQPDWDGHLFYTGPLARQRNHSLVAAIVRTSGGGLLAQMVARVVELSLLICEMQDFGACLCDDNRSQSEVAGAIGLGVVEAARGRLVHRVEVREGAVVRYQILAPTEWNFHPRGPLVQGLLGRPAGNDPQMRAKLLVAALDPCVVCHIEGP